MKKLILSLLFLTVQFCIYGQIRSTRDYQYNNGDTYWLEKTNSNLSRSIFTNSTASPSIGTYLAPSGTVSEACGIRVINLIREAGEDPKADNATNPYNNDLAILEVSLYNVYESYGGFYSPSNWSNNYYEVVLLDNSIAQADAATQWNAVMSAGAIAAKKYNETVSIDFKSYVNAGNAIITLGIRAQNLSNPWAASGFIFRFKGNVLVDEQISVTVKNNFNGGKIKAQVDTPPSTLSNSPATITNMTRKTLYMEAVEGSNQPVFENYTRTWNDTEGPINKSNWYKENQNGQPLGEFSSNVSTSITLSSVEKNYSYVADMKKLYNVTFQNSFVGVGNGGTVIVNGTQYNSPTSSFQVVEQNPITAEARGLPLTNGIEYSFARWNDGNTSSTRTFYPNANTTYTAYFIGKPTNSGENVVAGGYDFGQPIVVTWTDNPNPAVNQFQIWRKVKQDGDIPTLIATVGRGVQTYTDDTYIATNGYTNDLVQYDVRAYYSTEGTYSDPAWTAVFGKKNIYNIYEDKPIVSLSNELPTEYSISNYPNPFNPSTTINYQLPQDGMVTIKVYDMLGCEVATLVNENKPAGYYKVNFDASKLTSGVYIYTIRATAQAGQANNYVQSKKMLLMK